MELGACLRSIRERADLSGAQLAARTYISQSKISRIETGRLAPNLDDIESILDALDADERERSEVFYLAKRADSRSGHYRFRAAGGSRNSQSEIFELESSTKHYRSYDPLYVSGLLQTSEYMRSMISPVMRIPYLHDIFDVSKAVQLRLTRQAILQDADRQFEFMLTPEALRRPYLGVAGMRAQWSHITKMATRPNVSIGVLCDQVLINVWAQQFTVYDSEKLSMDLQFVSFDSSQPSDVRLCVEVYETLRKESLWGEDAVNYLWKLHRSS